MRRGSDSVRAIRLFTHRSGGATSVSILQSALSLKNSLGGAQKSRNALLDR